MQFYFAISSRPRKRDLQIARLVGQTHLLVPAGSLGARMLRHRHEFNVVLDSWAWPPHNPERPTLDGYWREVKTWRNGDGSWRCDWFAAYDTIGDGGQTQQDYNTLLTMMDADDLADAPLVPVTHYPGVGAIDILVDYHLGHAGTRGDLVNSVDGCLRRPGYALGGLVPARYSDEADTWYGHLLAELEAATDDADAAYDDWLLDPQLLNLHLFGVGRPSWVLRSPLVQSFDSSGPAQQARFGWPKIAQHGYTAIYGLTQAKLAHSREARLAYWLMHYRNAVGLPWTTVDETLLLNDGERMSAWGPIAVPDMFAA